MARYWTSGKSATALADNGAIASLVPGAAVGAKLVRVIVGFNNSGAAVTDFNAAVGITRGTARGTATATLTGVKADVNTAASGVTGVDTLWSTQPTIPAAGADAILLGFNSRGGADTPIVISDFTSGVGVANPIVLVNRSGAALPAAHSFTWTAEWEE